MPHPCPSSVTRECHGRASSPRRGARDQNLPLPRYRGAIAGYKWAFGVAGDETFCPLQRHSDKSGGGGVSRASLKIRGEQENLPEATDRCSFRAQARSTLLPAPRVGFLTSFLNRKKGRSLSRKK